MMILLQRKKEWTNKGNHKQEEADTLIYNTTSNTHLLYRIKKILLCGCWEIFDRNLIWKKLERKKTKGLEGLELLTRD